MPKKLTASEREFVRKHEEMHAAFAALPPRGDLYQPDDVNPDALGAAVLLAALKEITFACETAANLRGLTDLFPYVERAKASISVFEGEQS